jgi:hypothetical protein
MQNQELFSRLAGAEGAAILATTPEAEPLEDIRQMDRAYFQGTMTNGTRVAMSVPLAHDVHITALAEMVRVWGLLSSFVRVDSFPVGWRQDFRFKFRQAETDINHYVAPASIPDEVVHV